MFMFTDKVSLVDSLCADNANVYGDGQPLPGMSDLSSKRLRLALYGINPEFFTMRFQYILARRAKMYLNLIVKSANMNN